MKRRLKREATPRDAGSLGGELDADIWRILSKFIAAASRGDVNATRDAIPRLESELPNDGQAGMIVRYLLEYRVIDLLQRRPTPDDLHELAMSAWPRFAEVVNANEGMLEDLLRTVFEFAAEERKITGAAMIVLGSVALGALLSDPVAELETVRPRLETWWQRNAPDFRHRGIIGSGAGPGGPCP